MDRFWRFFHRQPIAAIDHHPYRQIHAATRAADAEVYAAPALPAAICRFETADPGCLQMRLALYEPDIPQNTGALMRLCACLGVPLDIIEPCGFILSDKNLRRAGMDYIEHLDL